MQNETTRPPPPILSAGLAVDLKWRWALVDVIPISSCCADPPSHAQGLKTVSESLTLTLGKSTVCFPCEIGHQTITVMIILIVWQTEDVGLFPTQPCCQTLLPLFLLSPTLGWNDTGPSRAP